MAEKHSTRPQEAYPDLEGQRLSEHLTSEMRRVIDDVVKAAEVCEWCGDQSIEVQEGGSMTGCIRGCNNVTDIAEMTAQMIRRNSMFTRQSLEMFADAAANCAEECEQHDYAHCQECASVLKRAEETASEALDTTFS